jgi:hypothetical protein
MQPEPSIVRVMPPQELLSSTQIITRSERFGTALFENPKIKLVKLGTVGNAERRKLEVRANR